MINPSQKTLRDVLRGLKRAKLYFLKSQMSGNSLQFQQSMSQNKLNQQ